MKIFICLFISVFFLLIGCDKQSQEQQKSLEAAAKSEVGQLIQKSKEVVEDLEIKAEEQAQQAAEAYEDVKIEIETQATEIEEDLKEAIEQ